MKKLYTIIAALVLTASTFAQAPEKMSYQAVVRDASDLVISDQPVGMQISILQDSETGTLVYAETQTPTTNANGLLSIEIGTGITTDDFTAIDWAAGPYFIKTETDPTGGTNYSITGTSQLLSVPYALYAKTAETLEGTLTETDPVFAANFDFTGAAKTDLLQFNGTKWVSQKNNYLSKYNVTEADIKTHEKDLTLTESQISDLKSYILDEIDPGVPSGTQTGDMQYWNGTQWVILAAPDNEGDILQMYGRTPLWGPPSVINRTTGKIWMDRNLGASQVATSSTDYLAYGSLYQWGRASDGHEVINWTSATGSDGTEQSNETADLSTTDIPGHKDFIIAPSSPYDWRKGKNDNLWQGVSGTNNPCPSGYRIPTKAEWEAERASWGSNNAAGAFASPLKLPVAGFRYHMDGAIRDVGTMGVYYSSTAEDGKSWNVYFHSGAAGPYNDYRAFGFSVRCIKD